MIVNLGVLISGGGTNLQAIIDACQSGILKDIAQIALVVSNKAEAFGLERAKKHGIPALWINSKNFPDNQSFYKKVSSELKRHRVNIVCLAGYMRMVDPCLIKDFKKKVLNIHPALLPKFGGKGMYGHFVHEAVIKAGEPESGATVHMVDEQYDHGPIVLQYKVPVFPKDTADVLAERVIEVEHRIYPEAILKVITGGKQ
ncbi:MAG: phosphoribosylglycinamide formyltransferase [Elusimicrobiota bacterium]